MWFETSIFKMFLQHISAHIILMRNSCIHYPWGFFFLCHGYGISTIYLLFLDSFFSMKKSRLLEALLVKNLNNLYSEFLEKRKVD